MFAIASTFLAILSTATCSYGYGNAGWGQSPNYNPFYYGGYNNEQSYNNFGYWDNNMYAPWSYPQQQYDYYGNSAYGYDHYGYSSIGYQPTYYYGFDNQVHQYDPMTYTQHWDFNTYNNNPYNQQQYYYGHDNQGYYPQDNNCAYYPQSQYDTQLSIQPPQSYQNSQYDNNQYGSDFYYPMYYNMYYGQQNSHLDQSHYFPQQTTTSATKPGQTHSTEHSEKHHKSHVTTHDLLKLVEALHSFSFGMSCYPQHSKLSDTVHTVPSTQHIDATATPQTHQNIEKQHQEHHPSTNTHATATHQTHQNIEKQHQEHHPSTNTHATASHQTHQSIEKQHQEHHDSTNNIAAEFTGNVLYFWVEDQKFHNTPDHSYMPTMVYVM